MAPLAEGEGLSAKRAQFAGPPGLKGLLHNGKTTAIATFAALGGFVYGCERLNPKQATREHALILLYRQPGNVWADPDHGSFYESRMLYSRRLLGPKTLTETRSNPTTVAVPALNKDF